MCIWYNQGWCYCTISASEVTTLWRYKNLFIIIIIIIIIIILSWNYLMRPKNVQDQQMQSTCPHGYPLSDKASSNNCQTGAESMAQSATKYHTNNILHHTSAVLYSCSAMQHNCNTATYNRPHHSACNNSPHLCTVYRRYADYKRTNYW